MPIVLSKKIDEHTELHLWQITEQLDALIEQAHFTTAEQARFDGFGNSRRKEEWSAVRALLNKVCACKVEVSYDALGKPALEGYRSLSISHCKGFVAVVLSSIHKVAIDIEWPGERVVRIKERFMNQKDLLSLNRDNEVSQVLLYWCLKEVLFKIAPIGNIDFKDHMHIQDLTPRQHNNKSLGIIRKNDLLLKANLDHEWHGELLIAWGVQIS